MTKQERNEMILKLHDDGLSYRDIARIVGCCKTNAHKIVSRIKNNVDEIGYPDVVRVEVGKVFKDDQANRLQYIDIALRLLNIDLHPELLKRVVSVVDLVNKKGGKSNLEDVVKCSVPKVEKIKEVSEEEARDNERLAELGFGDFIKNKD